jgi:hypothetical protein
MLAKLSAIKAVGAGALNVLGRTPPSDPYSQDGLAYSFVKNARQGDTAYADLDAVLLGYSIAYETDVDSLSLKKPDGYSLLCALIKRDSAAIASLLPEYTALNAIDMLTTLEDGLEGRPNF